MNIYLAGPFFNEEQIKYEKLVSDALYDNAKVDSIFRPSQIKANHPFGTPEWKDEIFSLDTTMIKQSDAVVMIGNFIKQNHEIILDPGTAVELGYANANDIPVYLVIFNEEPAETVLNVMVDLAAPYHIVGTEEDVYKQLQHLDFSSGNRKDWKTT